MAAGIALVGMLGQWIVGSVSSARASAKRDGALDEWRRTTTARVDKHGEEIDDLRDAAATDRGRIAVVEKEISWRRSRGC